MKWSVAAALALVAAGAGACGSPSSPPAKPSPAPSASPPAKSEAKQPFVVALVVDQFSAWVAAERLPLLPPGGGLGRLVREGTWVKTLRYPYAVTDTGPGHSSLHTGKVPAESGIWANELPDANGKRVTILRDEKVKTITPDGVKDVAGSSPSRLRADTVADRLRAARPDALVVSISIKDRGAILPAGKHPTHALWYETGAGSFVTSTAFEESFPKWATPIANAAAVEKARATPWEATDAAWLAAHAGKDDAPGEGNLDGLGITFPHSIKTSAAFRATPASDRMIFDLARAAVDAEYDPKKPTLLLLSLSATDVIGHTFGPDSWEAWDELRKLDEALGKFLDALEAKVGPVSVILSSDHGNVSMPEARLPFPAYCKEKPIPPDPYERPRCVSGERLGPNALRDELKAETVKVLGPGSWIAGLADPYVFLTPAARALDGARRAKLDRAVRHVLLENHAEGVLSVLDVRDMPRDCEAPLAKQRGIPDRARPGEDVMTLVCRSWSPAVEADYYVLTKLGSFFDGELVVGKGTSHGTPYLHDRTIPLLVRAKGAAAGAAIEAPVDFTAYSAIEASLLGLDPRDVPTILSSLTAR